MRDCPTRDGNQVHPNVLKDGAPKKRRFYALRTRGANPDEGDDDDGKFLYFSILCYEFLLIGRLWLVDGLEIIETCCMCIVFRSLVGIEFH